MSVVLKHFWTVTRRLDGGRSSPRKYGLSGCIPAVVRRTDGSYVAGTSEPDARRRWPFVSKKERKPSRRSSLVRIPAIVPAARARFGARLARPRDGSRAARADFGVTPEQGAGRART